MVVNKDPRPAAFRTIDSHHIVVKRRDSVVIAEAASRNLTYADPGTADRMTLVAMKQPQTRLGPTPAPDTKIALFIAAGTAQEIDLVSHDLPRKDKGRDIAVMFDVMNHKTATDIVR